MALGLAAAVGVGVAVWRVQAGGPAPQALSTATATRGDVVVSVGGVGRIVEAKSSGPVAVPVAAGGGATSGVSPAGSTPAAGATSAPGDAVFPRASGHVVKLLVATGQQVAAGQRLAVLDDGGMTTLAVKQAVADLTTARLELAQKRTTDPTKGLPPSPTELSAARLAVRVARQKLALIVGPPNLPDVTAARLDVRKAQADLEMLRRAPGATALAAAKLAVDVATQRLARASGPPNQADVTAAQLELKKAHAELEALRQAPPGPSATALQAAQLAVDLAKQKLAELDPSAPGSEVLAARLEVKKAEAELESLHSPPPPTSATALAAAQLAVDLASQKLAQITGPPSPVEVVSARLELKKAQADFETVRRGPTAIALSAAQLAVRVASEKLVLITSPPKPAILGAARLDVAKARVDLETLRKRGAPASLIDIAVARLKVQAARAHLALAVAQTGRMTVRAPWGGTVTSLLATRGTPADASTPIATVGDLDHIAVSVDLSEFDVARVRRGLPAVVKVDALGGKAFRGKVLFEALTGVDNGGVVTFPVKVGLPRVPAVKPGMNVSVRIIVAQRRNVVQVPLEAVSRERGHATVTMAGASGRTSIRRVTLGLASNKEIEIASGLRAGERVVLAGSQGE